MKWYSIFLSVLQIHSKLYVSSFSQNIIRQKATLMHVLKTIVFKKATDFRCLSFHVAIFAKHFAQDRILGCTNALVLNLKRSQLFERFMFFTSKTSSGEKLQVRFEFVWNVFVLNQAASRPKYREVAWMLSEKLYFCTTCCFIIFYSLA